MKPYGITRHFDERELNQSKHGKVSSTGRRQTRQLQHGKARAIAKRELAKELA